MNVSIVLQPAESIIISMSHYEQQHYVTDQCKSPALGRGSSLLNYPDFKAKIKKTMLLRILN